MACPTRSFSLFNSLSLLGMVATAWGSAVAGCSPGLDEELVHDEISPSLTFNGLVNRGGGQSASLAPNAQGTAPVAGTDDGTPTSGEPTPVTIEETVKLDVVSACHPGELDALKARLQAEATFTACSQVWQEQRAAHNVPPDFTKAKLVLESEDGDILGSRNLGAAELLEAGQHQRAGKTTQFERELTLTIPAALMKEGTTFRASLFVCSDSDDDGACSDEQISAIPPTERSEDRCGTWMRAHLERTPSVVVHQVFEAEVSGGDVTFTRVDANANANRDTFADASAMMNDMLRNFAPLTADGVSATLVARSTDDPECQPAPRTDGCFIEGTMIEIANGRTMPVEQVTPGTLVRAFGGRSAVVERVVAGPEAHPVIAIATSRGDRITVTQEHPMLTTAGVRAARALSFEDILLGADGQPVGIQSMASLDYEGKVWNFAVRGSSLSDHLIVVQGIVTGDLEVQRELAAPRVATR